MLAFGATHKAERPADVQEVCNSVDALAYARRKIRNREYCRRLSDVRTDRDWEGWTAFFLECVREAADDRVTTAQRLFALLNKDRRRLLNASGTTIPAIRLFNALPGQPVVTLAGVMKALKTTKPTASKPITRFVDARILKPGFPRWPSAFGMALAQNPWKSRRFCLIPAELTEGPNG